MDILGQGFGLLEAELQKHRDLLGVATKKQEAVLKTIQHHVTDRDFTSAARLYTRVFGYSERDAYRQVASTFSQLWTYPFHPRVDDNLKGLLRQGGFSEEEIKDVYMTRVSNLIERARSTPPRVNGTNVSNQRVRYNDLLEASYLLEAIGERERARQVAAEGIVAKLDHEALATAQNSVPRVIWSQVINHVKQRYKVE
ncbi:hypothetical protein HYX02_05685 [Candidatus Woesearchaeota archaeon]|nr:hypothetical protein [Candidatus Woesearchaeota archaeon]